MHVKLTAAQSEALLNGETGDVVVALLDEQFGQWPWWDSAWRVVEIREVRPRLISDLHGTLHTVTIDGTVGRDGEATLPMSVFARVYASGFDRFQVRVGEAVIGPPIRHDEPHPFGSILSALMDRRGISRKDLAFRCRLSESTVAKMRAGYHVPHEAHRVADLAAALDMPVDDLRDIVGLPEG